MRPSSTANLRDKSQDLSGGNAVPLSPAAQSPDSIATSLHEISERIVDGQLPDNDKASATEQPPSKKSTAGGRKRLAISGGALLAIIISIYVGTQYLVVWRYIVSTDDAYVRANATTIAARVAGYVVKADVADNANVQVGDLIFSIDDGDYTLAVRAARDKISTQEASIERFEQQIIAQTSAAEQAKGQLEAAVATARRAAQEFDRQRSLSERGFVSHSLFETATTNRDQANAAVKSAQAAANFAAAGVMVAKAQQVEARRALEEIKTALAKAERDLAFTRIRAPVDGVFANRYANVGDFVQPGQRLANIVPLNEVYIDANFKETQLARLRPGQPVAIYVDAYSEKTFEGHIDSLSPASGSVFTLLPPDNATGNFTKIVQRVPVRIRIQNEVAAKNVLRAGMSVVVKVNTKPSSPTADQASPAAAASPR
jgi:membrane fusion protein (multidrug efflux system)